MSEYSHPPGETPTDDTGDSPLAPATAPNQDRHGGLETLVFNQLGRVRAPWRLLAFITSVFFVSLLAAGAALLLGSGGGLTGGAIVLYLLLCLGTFVVSLLFLHVDRPPSAPLRALGLAWHQRVAPEALVGTAMGLCVNLALLGVGVSAGFMRTRLSSDLDWLALLAILVTLVFAALLEELYFRGYALQVLIEGAGVWPAVLLTSVAFGALHNANPHATLLSFVNTSLAGVLMAVLYVRTRSLWLPSVLHISWNASMAPLLGMPVSGIDLPARVLETELTERGLAAQLLTGGDYGPEGGLLLTVLAVALIVWAWRTPRLRAVEALRPHWAQDLEPFAAPRIT